MNILRDKDSGERGGPNTGSGNRRARILRQEITGAGKEQENNIVRDLGREPGVGRGKKRVVNRVRAGTRQDDKTTRDLGREIGAGTREGNKKGENLGQKEKRDL